jgi:hypothetical protein
MLKANTADRSIPNQSSISFKSKIVSHKCKTYLSEYAFSQKSDYQAHGARACNSYQLNPLQINKKSMALFSHFRINTLMQIASINQPLEELEARCVAVTMPKE